MRFRRLFIKERSVSKTFEIKKSGTRKDQLPLETYLKEGASLLKSKYDELSQVCGLQNSKKSALI